MMLMPDYRLLQLRGDDAKPPKSQDAALSEGCWNDSNSGNPGDGTVRENTGECSRRVVRGGSWVRNPGGLRSAIRIKNLSGSRNNDLGFRVARSLP